MDGMTACSVAGCDKPRVGQGFCDPHYRRFRRHGAPTAGRIHGNDEERFWSKVEKRGPGECWIWTGGLNTSGYGQFQLRRKSVGAHRWMYEHTIGKIPDGLLVCHTCDNPPCVNPAHLWLGTNGDNMRDSSQKGRRVGLQAGTNNGRAILTPDDVREIRRVYTGKYGELRTLARRYGVTDTTIASAVKGQTWSLLQ
jgi:hypothetical protein